MTEQQRAVIEHTLYIWDNYTLSWDDVETLMESLRSLLQYPTKEAVVHTEQIKNNIFNALGMK